MLWKLSITNMSPWLIEFNRLKCLTHIWIRSPSLSPAVASVLHLRSRHLADWHGSLHHTLRHAQTFCCHRCHTNRYILLSSSIIIIIIDHHYRSSSSSSIIILIIDHHHHRSWSWSSSIIIIDHHRSSSSIIIIIDHDHHHHRSSSSSIIIINHHISE